MRTEEEWEAAFARAEEIGVATRRDYFTDGWPESSTDGFYDDLALLPDAMYWRRLDKLMERHGPRVKHQRFEVLPPFERRRRRPMRVPRVGATSPGGFSTYCRDLDPLFDLSADEYVAVLGDVEVGGGRISCPLPDHEDLNPACSLDGNLWKCFSCGRGGSIYELAALLWGFALPLRGREFGEVRDRLKRVFGVSD